MNSMKATKPKRCLHMRFQETGVGDVSTRFLIYMSMSQCIWGRKSVKCHILLFLQKAGNLQKGHQSLIQGSIKAVYCPRAIFCKSSVSYSTHRTRCWLRSRVLLTKNSSSMEVHNFQSTELWLFPEVSSHVPHMEPQITGSCFLGEKT